MRQVASRPPRVVVVGAGHAGAEAALAAARLGCAVSVITRDADAVCRMSCNPAIGGLGKGHLVREVDALGGQMGLAADATAIQFRRLNTRKGAAVRGTRVQSDKRAYSRLLRGLLERQPRLSLVEGEVVALRVEGGRLRGVELAGGAAIECAAAVVTTGTFLGGMIYVGERKTPGGRHGEPASIELAAALRELGLGAGRLKTGTPCRLDASSIDFARLERQPGDDPPPRLSYWSDWPDGAPPLRQVPCHITYTNPRAHEIIRRNLQRSAIYSGAIRSTGPRYCPSIEDKIVRFPDRDRHQIFVEPEGLDSALIYPNGISTSLPEEVQRQLVASIVGFEDARILRFGYAVEYDYCDPTELRPSLAVPAVEGLFFAGQINGTTGYEEAAAQGLVAGINAARLLGDREPLRLRRDQAYIGVLIDDLVTRGIGGEPYRMFTSRAELRLLLREDNAAQRLAPLGREIGLLDDARWAIFCERQERLERLQGRIAAGRVPPAAAGAELERLLRAAGTTSARPGAPLKELLRRPEVDIALLQRASLLPPEEPLICEHAELAIKYAPYIQRQREAAARLADLEERALPRDLDYSTVIGLSNEVRERLERRRPESLGQASRLPGVTPAATALLEVHLRALQRTIPAKGIDGDDTPR